MSLAERVDFGDQSSHDATYRLDQSYPSSRMRSAFSTGVSSWHFTAMAEAFDIEIVRANLRRFMKDRNIKPTTLSQRIGPSKSAIKELLEKNDDVKLGTLYRIAEALEIELVDLISSQGEVVPLPIRAKWPKLSADDRDRIATFVEALPGR